MLTSTTIMASGNGDGLHQFRHAVGHEVLQRFDVTHRAGDQGSRTVAGEESVGKSLQVAIDALQQVAQQRVGSLMGGQPVEVAGGPAQQEHARQGGDDDRQRDAVRARTAVRAGRNRR